MPAARDAIGRLGGAVAALGAVVVATARWAVLGAVVGLLAGLASAAFLESLRIVTEWRIEHGWLVWLLPVAGLLIGATYATAAGRAARGSNVILDEIHDPQAWVPRRMAPLVFASTVLTHLVGGSAGREGTAIQMAGSLTDHAFRRIVPVTGHTRRVLLVAAIAGGFGSVFGVPVAGAVFALEVQRTRRLQRDAIVPALVASVTGDRLVAWLGVEHTPVPVIGRPDLDVALVAQVALAGVAFGLAAVVFVELLHGLKRWLPRLVPAAPLRPVVGGVALLALMGLSGTRDYLGLSIPLVERSLAGGAGVAVLAFAWKLVMTVVTLGSGFQGGEVTPLFVIGATLGATMGDAVGAPVPLFAAIGLVAVFAAATSTPIACTIMAVELFGAGPIVPVALACVLAQVVSDRRSIYDSPRREPAPATGAAT